VALLTILAATGLGSVLALAILTLTVLGLALALSVLALALGSVLALAALGLTILTLAVLTLSVLTLAVLTLSVLALAVLTLSALGLTILTLVSVLTLSVLALVSVLTLSALGLTILTLVSVLALVSVLTLSVLALALGSVLTLAALGLTILALSILTLTILTLALVSVLTLAVLATLLALAIPRRLVARCSATLGHLTIRAIASGGRAATGERTVLARVFLVSAVVAFAHILDVLVNGSCSRLGGVLVTRIYCGTQGLELLGKGRGLFCRNAQCLIDLPKIFLKTVEVIDKGTEFVGVHQAIDHGEHTGRDAQNLFCLPGQLLQGAENPCGVTGKITENRTDIAEKGLDVAGDAAVLTALRLRLRFCAG
jgi:hypothetical protein